MVAGDTELSQRAPVVELRIRKAVTGGAKVITVGVGGTRLETLRGAATSRPPPAPRTQP